LINLVRPFLSSNFLNFPVEMAESGPTLNGLAAAITQAASTISSYVDKHNLSAPSFAEDGPESYPLAPEVQSARLELWGAATDLLHLALGPQAYSLMYPIFVSEFSARYNWSTMS
jgi:hypothetical protein